MSGTNRTRCISFPSTINLARGLRVKLNLAGTSLELAAAGDRELGFVEIGFVAENHGGSGPVAVSVTGKEEWAIAAGAIPKYGAVDRANAGKVTGGGTKGIALQSATADGDRIRVLWYDDA